jgi:NADH:ubiquinone oxidoreductase subunit C
MNAVSTIPEQSLLEAIPEKLGVSEPWAQKGGVYWLASDTLNIRDLASVMNASHARFITITAYQMPGDQGLRLEYHWDLDGKVLGFSFPLAANSFESIYDLCEAVDWIEREIHEGFAVDFTGRDYEPLLLRQGDTPGVNLRKPASALSGQEEVKK